MMQRDVHATLASLPLLVETTKGAEPFGRLNSYAAVKALCADFL